MHTAVLGLGEAGRVFARAFAEAGDKVTAFDPGEVETPTGVHRAESAAEAVNAADLVVCLTTAQFALSVAKDCRESLDRDCIYLDMNAAAPSIKQQVAVALEGSATVADGAVIGSVQSFGAGVEVLLSGPGCSAVAQHLNRVGARTTVLDGATGDASGRKLLRSVFMKGLGALIQESAEVGDAAGQGDWVRQQMADALVGGHETVERMEKGIRTHALRRQHELSETLSLIGDFPGTWPMTHAAKERHVMLARRVDVEETALSALRTVPTAAIGDGTDRLGFVGHRLKPVWDCPQIAGSALTVMTQAGDNYGIHQALEWAKAGDVLVVSAEGGSHRALLGDLLAERAVAAGIQGVIVDGPVRDAHGIAASGLPVWASGVSAAGPYKAGPTRLGTAVAIGSAVCQPGDIVVADSEGILFVPPTQASAVAEGAQAVLDDERRRRESWK